MTTTKHTFTPGPWKLVKWHKEHGEALIQMGSDAPYEDGKWHWAGWMATRDKQNARLIVAAPDLLEALEHARMMVIASGSDLTGKAVAMYDRAIEKATGGK